MKRLLGTLIVACVMFTTVFANAATAFAATGSKTFTASGSMALSIPVGVTTTGTSSEAVITVSGLPADAKITNIELNTGKAGTSTGALFVNSILLKSSNNAAQYSTAWSGGGNNKFTVDKFKASQANGTYRISFTGSTYSSVTGGSRSYSGMTLTIYWSDFS